jgi:hypothetical protein
VTDEQIIKAFEEIDYAKPETIRYGSPVPPTFVLASLKRQKVENKEIWEERCRIYKTLKETQAQVREYRKAYNDTQAEIERLKNLVDGMSVYFPSCIDCDGKTTVGVRTDKCVYLEDDTNYCAKRGIDNISRILKENETLEIILYTDRKTNNFIFSIFCTNKIFLGLKESFLCSQAESTICTIITTNNASLG